MKPELLHITNVSLVNSMDNQITYTVYNDNVREIENGIVIFSNVFSDWNVIYNELINNIIELGKINKSNSEINDVFDIELSSIQNKIDDVFNYLINNDKFNGIKFLIINQEIYNIIKDLLDTYYIDVQYHINNNIQNNIIFGIRNKIDEEGFNIYFNKQRAYSIIKQGQDISKYYFTLNYDII